MPQTAGVLSDGQALATARLIEAQKRIAELEMQLEAVEDEHLKMQLKNNDLGAENKQLTTALKSIDADCQKGIRRQIIDTDICWCVRQALRETE
jgi:septal ring factor EnvC (AmiA/AmiB activator)